MELWGGIECTRNRVGSQCFDQLARSGHYARGGDLERIAALGIRMLRYPLLWERATTASRGEYDFSFADERVPMLRDLGITPIAGLVHHGSGPEDADLLSPRFATGLAAYAGALAARFPELEWYTPVNEPLTTARFAGLYGLWQPHGRSSEAFARMLVNECRATILAMRAIRAVNPGARLVQTDDLGTIYSTRALAYQAEFENERRWLSWDLLCGRVDAGHPMHAELLAWGIPAHELDWLQENCCPPAIIGIDHYVTSDRYLDEEADRYPRQYHGRNAYGRYADVEAVRVLGRPGTSLRSIVLEAARRYRLPIALTEVHIGCTVQEQVRWLDDAWTICEQLEAGGVDIRAVTAWALLGSYDWDTLLTRGGATYESGAFCLRDGDPRPTALAEYIAIRARGGEPCQVAGFTSPPQGWWRQPQRLIYGTGRPIAERVQREAAVLSY